MASLYKRSKSPYWYLRYFDVNKGKWASKTTSFLVSSRSNTTEALKLAASLSKKEQRFSPSVRKDEQEASWEGWVENFLKLRAKRPRTFERYALSWKYLFTFLKEVKIGVPSKVTRQTVYDYIKWRQKPHWRSEKVTSINTCIIELRVFSLVMAQAIKLGYYQGANPCKELEIARTPVKKIKPEITQDELETIESCLGSTDEKTKNPKYPQWMMDCFKIARWTGCRLRETQIPMSCVNFEAGVIHFPQPKGGEERAFDVPIHPELLPLLKSKKGKRFSVELPRMASKLWWQFFKENNLSHLCFHCLRVTFVSQLARAGVDQRICMALVNHSSELVHRIYTRHKMDDLRNGLLRLQAHGVPSTTPAPPSS